MYICVCAYLSFLIPISLSRDVAGGDVMVLFAPPEP